MSWPVEGSEDPQPITVARRAMAAVSEKEAALFARRLKDPAPRLVVVVCGRSDCRP